MTPGAPPSCLPLRFEQLLRMLDGWMDGEWMDDGWMDGWMMDGWMDGWVGDGWMMDG
jgi:hypothetical protein